MSDPKETANGSTDKSWRSLWISSWVMSLCLFGDALIYIVLPVNAELFGVSLVWVGILLAANRIIRTFTYGWVARLGEWIGLKNLCIFASCTAVLSTLGYGLLEGGFPLLAARTLWGLSYAGLLLVTLAYAARDRAKTGTRVGVSRAVEQVGPIGDDRRNMARWDCRREGCVPLSRARLGNHPAALFPLTLATAR